MTNTSNQIVFFGNEKLATGIPSPEPLIRHAAEAAGFEVEQIVTGKLSDLKPHKARLAVLAAYGHIIPQRILDDFPLGIINIHPSLLPLYRGPTPIEQAMLDGVTKTGVSIMHLTKGMDDGPIYKQKTVHLSGKETKTELTTLLQKLGAELLQEILPAIATGELKPRQQPHPERATYSQKIAKEHGVIDWTEPAVILERKIRAYSGWPKSHATIGVNELVITEARVSQLEIKPTPGKIFAEKKRLFIGTGEAWLEIICLQPLGKKEMPVSAFLSGYRSQLGV